MTRTMLDDVWKPLAAHLVDSLRSAGAIHAQSVADAFSRVPRHAFIPSYYDRGKRTTTTPGAPTQELLELAYSNRGIMTHTPGDEAGTYSSASQPSVVARMLEAAELQQGHRVLEVGAGTGFNSALIHHITRTRVVTIDASPVVADEARRALATTESGDITVHTGDGFLGDTSNGPYDRIIVTCGISAIADAWLDQLAPGGHILAPLAMGGLHPLTRVEVVNGTPQARLIASADFMAATGPLYSDANQSPSVSGSPLPLPAPDVQHQVTNPLEPTGNYIDLWLYLAVHDARTTCAGGPHAGCVLASWDEPPTAAYLRPDGTLLASHGADLLVQEALRHISQWQQDGQPALTSWGTKLTPARQGLHRPTSWHSLTAPTP